MMQERAFVGLINVAGEKNITKLTENPSSTDAHYIFTRLLCQNSCAQAGVSTVSVGDRSSQINSLVKSSQNGTYI